MAKRNSGNPKPVITPGFEAKKIPKLKNVDLAKKPIPVRFSVQADAILRAMENRQQFIRDAVDAAIAAQEQAKLSQPSTPTADQSDRTAKK